MPPDNIQRGRRRHASLSLDEARRIALAAQGFDRPRPGGGVDARHLRRTIQQLGLLQIDFVNVLVPAHYQVPFSRLGPYERSHLDDLVYRRREFTEQWAHEASILPMQSWPLLDHRRKERRKRPYGFAKILQGNAGYVAEVLQEVRRRGPLAADDLKEPAGLPRRIPGAWIGSVGRVARPGRRERGAARQPCPPPCGRSPGLNTGAHRGPVKDWGKEQAGQGLG